jgi:hypothetical protein
MGVTYWQKPKAAVLTPPLWAISYGKIRRPRPCKGHPTP